MRENTEKARSAAATVERAKMEAETGQATTSTRYDNTVKPSGQRISDLLGYGSNRGLTLTDLHRITRLDKRVIRLMIRNERISGTLIISDNKNGYYLTDSPSEAQRFARNMRHRAQEITQVAEAVEKAAR